jgi:AICAR transformylase/IMP cyclohydrolase PurH
MKNCDINYILQPGGSIRDLDIEEACKKYGIHMILSNQKVFTY